MLTAAGSTGQLLFVPLVASLTERLGWRGAVLFVAAGALRAWLGDYQVSFISAGVLCLVAVGMVVSIKPPPTARDLLAIAQRAEG